ncbi:hypothetical protein EG68_08800 [Paragonimus skrjabini miyazakii]|uniref:Uncharacterized protein n=1 Tax=Paragonimus skrjabini miyazakii TaxID=59628 RepID=A0A8S9YLE0_9TREM|nr:hypothetical protein EG68_08800 [Paragonimus skrjabini miyazakii]
MFNNHTNQMRQKTKSTRRTHELLLEPLIPKNAVPRCLYVAPQLVSFNLLRNMSSDHLMMQTFAEVVGHASAFEWIYTILTALE